MNRVRNDSGQAAVLSVLFLVGLLGALSLVLDVGSWFRAQRAAQSAADAAALAGAQALPDSPGTSSALATEYLDKNDGGTGAFSWSTKNVQNDTIRVTVTRKAPGVFSKLFGIDSVTVKGTASARTGSIDRARYAAPIAVDRRHPLLNCTPLPCFNQTTTLELEKVGPGAFRLLNLDRSKGGSGGQVTADWIMKGFDGYMALGWYGSDPGAAFNDSKVKEALDIRRGDELLFPVYDRVQSQGANFEYRVVGWVGFVVTDFKSQGNNGTIDGYFVSLIWEGIQSQGGGEEFFGVRSVELIE